MGIVMARGIDKHKRTSEHKNTYKKNSRRLREIGPKIKVEKTEDPETFDVKFNSSTIGIDYKFKMVDEHATPEIHDKTMMPVTPLTHPIYPTSKKSKNKQCNVGKDILSIYGECINEFDPGKCRDK